MKRTLLCLFVLAIAAWAPAPLVGHPSDRKLLQPEATTQDRERMQGLAKEQSEVGSVDEHGGKVDQAVQMSDPDASKAISSAKLGDPPNDPLAAAAVADAGDVLQHRGSKSSLWLWGILLAAVGFGLVMLFRQWANKHIPEMPTARDARW